MTSVCPLDRNRRVEDFLLSLKIPKSWIKNFLNVKQLNVSGQQEVSLPLDVLTKNMINPIYEGPEIKILAEDDRFIAFDKPSGIHSHPQLYSESNNCLSFLRSTQKGTILNVNAENYDRGLLFRLDFETSGVLIYCKDEKLRAEIFVNRQEAISLKRYVAVARGDLSNINDISLPLKPFGKKGRKMIVSPSGTFGEMKVTQLDFNPEKNMSLVKVDLKTGLRHQIRAQLAHLGHPLLGDDLYGGDQADMLYLHSSVYQIRYKEIEFKVSSTPESFLNLF